MEKYIVVTTLSDNLNIIKNIQKGLLEKHLVSGCQISEVNSTYWWNNEINESNEYKLEVRTLEKFLLLTKTSLEPEEFINT